MTDNLPRQIAIVGIGCRFPRGLSNHRELWQLLERGDHTVREVPSTRPELLEYFDPEPGTPGRHNLRYGSFFKHWNHLDITPFDIPPEEAGRIDPQQLLLLEVSQAALDDAGLGQQDELRQRAGVFVGLMASDHEERLHRQPESLRFSDMQGAGRFGVAGRVASCLGLGGPSLVVDSACSSSLLSVHLACQSLRLGECSLALAGGVNLLLGPANSICMAHGGMFSEDGLCRFGDAEANGFGRGEGAGIVVLRPLAEALAAGQHIYAVIRGGAVVNRRKAGEQGEEHERAAREALKAARVAPSEIQYLEVGSVASLMSDYLELLGLGRILREDRQPTNPCWAGSVKTNLAHTEGASGITALIKVALALERGQIPASLHFRKPSPLVLWDEVPWKIVERLIDWPGDGARRASVHSFGLSGTVVHLVLEGVHTSVSPAVLPLARQSPMNELPLPRLVHAPQDRFEPFPQTDLQQAYLVGRQAALVLSGVACHSYQEIEFQHLDTRRLEWAWQRLVERHDMLRAVMLPEGCQRVLDEVPPVRFPRIDLRAISSSRVKAVLTRLRDHLSHRVAESDRFPLFDIRLTRLTNDHWRLHLSFDLLIVDAAGMLILLDEWRQIYQTDRGMPPLPSATFRDYVLSKRDQWRLPAAKRARAYWRKRLDSLPPGPELPLLCPPESLAGPPRFRRLTQRLDSATWRRLQKVSAERGTAPRVLLCAAFAETLSCWSASPSFTLNLALFASEGNPLLAEIIGDFTSNLLLEIPSEGATFATYLEGIERQQRLDMKHLEASGVWVQRELGKRYPERALSGLLAPVVLTFLPPPRGAIGKPEPGAWLGRPIFGISQTPNVWLDHQIFEDRDELVFNWDLVDGLFPPGLMERMFHAFVHLLVRLAEDEDIWELPRPDLLGYLERQTWQRFNTPEHPFAGETNVTLCDGWIRQVACRPDATAIQGVDGTLSFGELHRRAWALGGRLNDRGVARGQLVAILLPPSTEQIIAVLGVLATGAAYLPMDINWPVARRRVVMEEAAVVHCIALQEEHEDLDGVQWLDPSLSTPVHGAVHLTSATPEDLAYVIYTSGSGGRPKGVMMTHRAAVNTLKTVAAQLGLNTEDRVLGVSALSFDLSVFDIFGVLGAGGTLVLPDAKRARNPSHWRERLEQGRVSLWNSVPALMELLTEHLEASKRLWPRTFRWVLLSGDWIPTTLPTRVNALAACPLRIMSLGGATEAAIWSIWREIESVDPAWSSIPYGRPMTSQQIYVLDESLRLRSTGVLGRIYIGGAGVARGYLHRAAETRRRFVYHPKTGERLFYTGDLGRLLPTGEIELVGRDDLQVKIHGHRIEIGEVESALLQHPRVAQVSVVPFGPLRHRRGLRAFIVAKRSSEDTTTPLESEDLRRFATSRLPTTFVPSYYLELAELPLSANGKVDRAALESLPLDQALSVPHIASTTRIGAMERQILEILGGILGRRVQPNSNLLQLGATSIDLIRFLGQLEQALDWHTELPDQLSDLLANPTSEGFARHLAQRMGDEEELESLSDQTLHGTATEEVEGAI